MRRLGIFPKKPPKKIGVLLCLPSLTGWNRSEQITRALIAGAASVRPDMPFMVEPYQLLNRAPVEDARNECSQFFMEKRDYPYLAFWDDDQIPPDNWTDLIGKGDIVSGLTLMWDAQRAAHQRLQFNQMNIRGRNQSETVLPTTDGKPYEVDIVGTACMVIHRRVFERLGPRPFDVTKGPDGRKGMGEDVYFCRAARAAGFKVTIIPDVVFEHVKPVGLVAMYEMMTAITQMAKRAGYEKGHADALAGRQDVPEMPTLAKQVEAAS